MNWQNNQLLKIEHILASHQMMIETHGGAPGILDYGLLESVVGSVQMATQYQTFTVYQLAAKYGFKLVKNHCFQDGNKRVGAHIMLIFLDIHGIETNMTDDELVETTLAVAQGSLSEDELAVWLESKSTGAS